MSNLKIAFISGYDLLICASLFSLVLLSNLLSCDRRSLPTDRPLKLADLIFRSPEDFQRSRGTVTLSKYV